MLIPHETGGPLAAAQAAIEEAAAAAWLRTGCARSMAAHLTAGRWLAALASGSVLPQPCAGMAVELARMAGLQTVEAAAADDDMRAMQAELQATLAALAAA